MADARYECVQESCTIHALMEITLDLLKTFIDDNSYNSGHGHAYEKYGVCVEEGAIVIVRPDHCESHALPLDDYLLTVRFHSDVSLITTLDDFAAIGDFFEGFALATK
jgi:phenol 2-monooxygenase